MDTEKTIQILTSKLNERSLEIMERGKPISAGYLREWVISSEGWMMASIGTSESGFLYAVASPGLLPVEEEVIEYVKQSILTTFVI